MVQLSRKFILGEMLARNATGKVLKTRLRARFRSG